MVFQRTIKKAVTISGIGVHDGRNATLTLKPAPENTSIIFRRIDLQPAIDIPATIEYSGVTALCTCVEKNNARVATVEHLLSALSAFQIDNCYAELSSEELPILDGSAKQYVTMLQEAGIVEQSAPKQFLKILKTVEVRDGEKFARLSPYTGFQVEFEIHFPHPVINQGAQKITFDFSLEKYIADIAAARTFGFYRDYEKIRAQNLARGASLENTIVLTDDGVMNEEPLRFSDEFVRHKILDTIGDLFLLGHNVIGAFSGYKSGHALNSALMKKLLTDKTAYTFLEW